MGAGRVFIVGCGALGGTVADLLVRAGVGNKSGRIALVDFDVVQQSNLQRQTLFTEQDVGRRKVDVARKALTATDSSANLEILPIRFTEDEIVRTESFDLLIDASDNFAARFLLNAAAVRFRKPFITAGVSGASGQIMTLFPGRTACLACLLDPEGVRETPEPPVLGPTPQLCAALQTLEAIKILSGHTEAAATTLRWFDLWTNRFREIPLERNPRCPACAGSGDTVPGS